MNKGKNGTHSVLPAVLSGTLVSALFLAIFDAPFRATVFFFTELIAASGMTVFPAFRTGVTLTSSHSMGTCQCVSSVYLVRKLNDIPLQQSRCP